MIEYIVTIKKDSRLNIVVKNLICALCYLKINNITSNLIVNLYFTTEPIKFFLHTFINVDFNIKFIDVDINNLEIQNYNELFDKPETNLIYEKFICKHNCLKQVVICNEIVKTIWKVTPEMLPKFNYYYHYY